MHHRNSGPVQVHGTEGTGARRRAGSGRQGQGGGACWLQRGRKEGRSALTNTNPCLGKHDHYSVLSLGMIKEEKVGL